MANKRIFSAYLKKKRNKKKLIISDKDNILEWDRFTLKERIKILFTGKL